MEFIKNFTENIDNIHKTDYYLIVSESIFLSDLVISNSYPKTKKDRIKIALKKDIRFLGYYYGSKLYLPSDIKL